MGDQFGLEASGAMRKFSTGSQRDASGATKPHPEYMSPFALLRFGAHMLLGALKYGTWNWSKGQPVSEMFASMYRHMLWFEAGDRSEDHLSAIIFGAQGIMHFEELAKRGDTNAFAMLDAYASKVLAEELMDPDGEQDPDAIVWGNNQTYERVVEPVEPEEPEVKYFDEVSPEDVAEAQRIFAEGALQAKPVAVYGRGDGVTHKSGWTGRISEVLTNGDCKIVRDDDRGIYYFPVGLMRNFTFTAPEFGND